MHNSDRRSWLSGPKGPAADEGGGGETAQRQQRVARYKEERRKQLATQFGTRVTDTSGSSSSDPQSSLSRVRTTKTSRLRAAATTTASDSGGQSSRVVHNGVPSTRSRDGVQQGRTSISTKGQTISLGRRSGISDRRAATATSNTSSHSDREKAPVTCSAASDGTSSTTSRREKDKSSKRKSNLNRSLTAEEVHLDEIHDDPGVRRRRRRAEPHVPLGVLDSVIQPSAIRTEQPRSSLQFHTPVKTPPTRSELPKIPSQPRASIQLTKSEQAKSLQPPPTSRLEHARILSSKSERAKTPPESIQPTWQEHSKSPQQFLGLRPDSSSSPSPQPRTMQHTTTETKNTTPTGQSPSPPPKLKQNALSLYNETPQPSKVSQKMDKLISMTEETVARLDRLTDTTSSVEDTSAMTHADSPRSWSGSPSRHRSSILKKKSLEEPTSSSSSGAIPVSILKRKTSQDEAGGPSLPVTFSPSVLEPSSKRQGILKKRSSLDESEVLRRRSYSPDMAGVEGEFRPILKNQRRLSMEELVRRAQSPDPVQPQSILKRKWSREDEASVEDRSAGSPEPQGILKRKSGASSGSSSSSTSPHVSIATAVILSVASDALEDNVRPILKKKNSSEDKTTGTSDSLMGDTIPAPKPILKKKSSADVDDLDQACQPVKPILKSSRKCLSQDDASWEVSTSSRESPVRCLKLRSRSSDSTSGSESEVRPILKTPGDSRDRSASPRHKLSFCEQEPEQQEVVVLRRTSDGRCSRSPVQPRPGSVAERIMNMESFLGQATGAVPKRLGGSHRASRDRERFHTQPITLDELNASSRLESVRAFQKGVLEKKQFGQEKHVTSSPWIARNGGEEPATYITSPVSPRKIVDLSSPTDMALSPETRATDKAEVEEELNSLCRSSSVVAKASMFAQLEEEMRRAAEEVQLRRVAPGSRFRTRERDTSRFSTQPVTLGEVQQAAAQTTETTRLQEDDRKQGTGEDEDEPSQLSLAERVKLFNQKSQEEAKPRTMVPKRRPVLSTRFKTQPVTTEEVETARHISPLAASLAKPPDPKLLGGMSARAAREKMYEHGAAILAKSSAPSRLATSKHKEDEDATAVEIDVKPKGILKNLTKSPPPGETAEASSSDDSEGEVKGILKAVGTPAASGTATPELESFRHLKSVLKKETENQVLKTKSSGSSENLRSILKRESTEWDESSSSSSESSDSEADTHTPVRPLSVPTTRNTLDLVSILHGVEANARKQRQALVSAPNNNHEKAMNIRNLQHEKHEKENCARRQENHYVKQLDIDPTCKSTTKQRRLETKQLSDELIRKTKETSMIVEKNHRTRPVELICKVNSSQKTIENETAKYERQLHRQIEELQHLSSPNDTTTPPTSDGETSSSGGREVQRIIRNEAVARRRQAALARQQKDVNKGLLTDLQKSKSHSAVPCPGAVPVLVLPQQDGSLGILSGLKRSSTQPLTDCELRDKDSMSGASIAERLAALQKSGNNDWRKRLSRLNPEEDLTIICNTTQFNHLYTNHEHHEQIPSPPRERAVSPGSGILADRLGKLDAATQGWRKRVGPTDAVQFSVAGRMNHTPPPPATLLQQQDGERKRRTPRARSFRSKAEKLKEVASTPSSPQKDLQISFKRSISAPGGDDENDLSLDRQNEVLSGPKVTVPRADDETFTNFFCSSILPAEKCQSEERVDIRDEDLDSIVSSSSQLLVQKRTVRVQRKVNPSRNPLRALAARTDLQDAYVDIRTGVAEKELKRLKVEKLAKHSSLAVEALAGLASKEDFTAVSLKKASALSGAMLPYKDLMLLQVKGRRHVQTRLVEPVANSINSGDNYVLVTPTEVYNYVGRYSNVIEQSRGAEVAQQIQQTKDLGCSGAQQVITLSEEKQTCSNLQAENFWKLLGSSSTDVASAGHPDEDELYESAIIASNMIYELQGEELVPMTEYWGTIPKIEMLDPGKVLLFDFGTEMYIWCGKNGTMEMKRMAQVLARELWAEGYDYSECDICPLNVASVLGQRSSPSVDKDNMAGPARPPWALLAKVNQHMETVLFREKFLNWPDFSRVIRTKGDDDEEKQVDASIDVQPCDAQLMLDSIASEPDLELESSHVGRGSQYYDEETHRHFEIKTADVIVWHITEYEHEKLPYSSVGQFHAGDSYVVRWLYSMIVTGRELSGQPSRHCTSGRDRCAYFCWQGSVASLNEQGAAALLTVELDQERGPQVRVVQGMEPPAFLSLFKGHMAVHAGKRDDQPDRTWRMYISRGEVSHEGVLVEVPCSMRHLRSRASFILLNTKTGRVFVWHGVRSQPHTKQVARTAAQHLKSKPEEFGFYSEVTIEIQELEEGMENSTFFQALGGANRQLYVSLQQSSWPCDTTPRLFHLSSVSGTFSFTEVFGPYRSIKTVTSFPFLQSDLYSASQPALFLLDNKEELWLWQGWWPEQEGDDSFSDARGSGCVRWQAERRAAMHTALDYWKLQHKDKPLVAYLVWAGLEPLAFTNLFPIWNDRDDIAELNIRDGRKPGEVLKVEEELARLTRSTYPAAQLLQRPLPDGVDPTRLELYLNPEHFQELLGMTKEEFLELPAWKQTKMKKEVGLF